MAYSKTVWVDGAAPALDAAHLNNLESGVEANDIALTSLTATVTTNTNNIATNATDIATNATAITNINTEIASTSIIRTGTFSGTWSPTLGTTFNITNYTDYNWIVNVHQTSRTTTNGHLVLLDGYLDVDNNTLRFTSSDDGAAVTARYTLIGIKKTMSNFAQLNG